MALTRVQAEINFKEGIMERIINDEDYYLIRKEDVDKHSAPLGFKIHFCKCWELSI